jgi:ABC-type antimicrobial peptide transport system permease subunit
MRSILTVLGITIGIAAVVCVVAIGNAGQARVEQQLNNLGDNSADLIQELGHESLATTQDYLADVRREDEAKKAVADADFVPKPHLVSGKDGD